MSVPSYRPFAELSTEGMLMQTDEKIVFVNQAMIAMLRVGSENDCLGKNIKDFFSSKSWSLIAQQQSLLMQGTIDKMVVPAIEIVQQNGGMLMVEVHGACLQGAGAQTIYWIIREYARTCRIEDQLRQLAYHDPLTGLFNRTAFEWRIKEAIGFAKRRQEYIGLLFVDIDYLKKINDLFGHAVGDSVLQAVAYRLKSGVRQTDIVVRWGGDEFIVALLGITQQKEIARVAEKLVKALAQPVFIKEHALEITASIGVSIYPEDGQETALLLNKADAALYRAKKNGRNRVAV